MNVAANIAKYNAAPYIATGYPATLAGSRTLFSVPSSLNIRVNNPLYYATISSIPALPRLGRFYYRMLMHFDGAVYNYWISDWGWGWVSLAYWSLNYEFGEKHLVIKLNNLLTIIALMVVFIYLSLSFSFD